MRDKSFIDDIFLVGGSIRIPQIKKLYQVFCNDEKLNRCISLDGITEDHNHSHQENPNLHNILRQPATITIQVY